MSEPWWFNDQQMCSGCYKCSAEYKNDVWLKLNKSILIVEAVSGSLVDFARLSVTGPRLLEWCRLLVQARTPELTVSRLANCFWWQLHQQINERKTVSKQCSLAFSGVYKIFSKQPLNQLCRLTAKDKDVGNLLDFQPCRRQTSFKAKPADGHRTQSCSRCKDKPSH